jgi:hypothetical protein
MRHRRPRIRRAGSDWFCEGSQTPLARCCLGAGWLSASEKRQGRKSRDGCESASPSDPSDPRRNNNLVPRSAQNPDAGLHQQDECKKRGTRCRAAEDAVTAARAKLATSAPVQSADPGAERLAAVLGIQSSTVQLYAPLLLPIGLELGGFIFLAAKV